MQESAVVLVNMYLYIALFVFCLLKYKWYNLSTVLSLMYAACSIASLLLHSFPLYSLTYTSQGHITIQACLYQFLLNSLLIMAFCKCNIDKCKILTNYNPKFIINLQIFLCIIITILLLFKLPEAVGKFFSSADLSNLRNESYGVNTTSGPFIIQIFTRFFGSTPIVLLSVVCIKILMLRKFSKLDKYSAILYILWKIAIVLRLISRATIIFSLIELVIILCLFHSYISTKIKKNIIKYTLIILPCIYLIFSAISYARFGANKDDLQKTLATLRYSGEAQLQFMGLLYPDLKEPFNGFTQLLLFRRVLGLPYDDGLGREDANVYNSYIQRYYKYPHPTYVFYGLSGEFVFNWGFIGAVILCLLINISLHRSFKTNRKVSTMQIILVIIMAAYVGKGVFFADYENESGNLMIIFLIYMYFYLKNDSKSVLLSWKKSQSKNIKTAKRNIEK